MDHARQAQLERIMANRKTRGATAAVPLQEGLEPPRAAAAAAAAAAPPPPPPAAAASSPPPTSRPSAAAAATSPPPQQPTQQPTSAVDSGRPATAASAAGRVPPPQDGFMNRVAAAIRPTDPQSLAAASRPSAASTSAPTASGRTASPRLRSGSVVSSHGGDDDASSAAATAPLGTDPNSLFARGRFDDFRRHPTLVVDASAIKPYRSERRLMKRSPSPASATSRRAGPGSSAAAPYGAAATTRSASAAFDAALSALPVTEPNPFRTQPFEAFFVSPDYSTPPHVDATMQRARRQLTITRNHRQENLGMPGFGVKREASPQLHGEPVFHQNEAIAALSQGDWFLKWTRRKDKIHRRYFWLNDDVLYWAKAPGVVSLLASCIRLSEIVQIDSASEIDVDSGRTFYVMTIWSVSRAAQIGTEISAKFDLWYETLKRLTAVHREHNLAYFSRHATMQPLKHDSRVVGPAGFAD